jgi:hypothetical protein
MCTLLFVVRSAWEKPLVKIVQPLFVAGVIALLGACAPTQTAQQAPPPPPPVMAPAPMAAPAPPPVEPYVAPAPRHRYAHRHVNRHYVRHHRHHRVKKPAK